MIEASILFCLNPDCPIPSQRQFAVENIEYHCKCEGWIIDDPSRFFKQPPVLKNKQFINKMYNFSTRPLHCLSEFSELKNWPDQFNDLVENLKVSIFNDLQVFREQKLKQFKQLIGFLECVHGEVRTFLKAGLEDVKSDEFFSLLRNVKNVGILKLYNRNQLSKIYKGFLCPAFKNISDEIQVIVEDKKDMNGRREKAIEETTKYLNDQCIHVNEKIQKITSIFKCNMVKIQTAQEKSKTECFLCKTTIVGQNKKNIVLENLLKHLYNDHKEKLYLQFMNKVLKFDVQEISFSMLVNDLHSTNYQKVFIIDRQNAGNFEKPLQHENYYIEVVSKMNKNLAKGRYLTAGSQKKDAADLLIVIVTCEILRICASDVILITGDHFGEVLQEVMRNSFGNRFTSIRRNQFDSFIE